MEEDLKAFVAAFAIAVAAFAAAQKDTTATMKWNRTGDPFNWETSALVPVKSGDTIYVWIQYVIPTASAGTNLYLPDAGKKAKSHTVDVEVAFSHASMPMLKLQSDKPFTMQLLADQSGRVVEWGGKMPTYESIDPKALIITKLPHKGMLGIKPDEHGVYDLEVVLKIK